MRQQLNGIHHITALAADAQRNAEFYTSILGMRLIKKTVNFDAPDVYHLYYGDNRGTPGTLLTFFPFPRAARGERGAGEASSISFLLPTKGLDYWIHHLSSNNVQFDVSDADSQRVRIALRDPDGLKIQLEFENSNESIDPWVGSLIPTEYAIRRFSGLTLSVHDLKPTVGFLTTIMRFSRVDADDNSQRFDTQSDHPVLITVHEDPSNGHARMGTGSVHHIAWRITDTDLQEEWRAAIKNSGTRVTDIVDRRYFKSIYFHEPGGTLFEIATDGPGFLIDESPESLGRELMLPSWLESSRTRIETRLPPLELPNHAETTRIQSLS
ncbi:MAG: ring-cleaving dioxygenase [Ignavibacteria bacterium]|nr:ring-cleaving dioxygenase [Ignavibacteria bacterium]